MDSDVEIIEDSESDEYEEYESTAFSMDFVDERKTTLEKAYEVDA